MVHGYWNKFLEADLTKGSIKTTPFDDGFARKYLGGLGFGTRLLFDRVKRGIDPLSPDNVLMLMFGPLNGTCFPGQKACWIFKSPLTGGIGRARSGGAYTSELKRAGWDGIIFTGKADGLVYLYVKDDEVEIRDAKHLALRDTQYTEHTIKQELDDPFTRVVCCGPAGENLVRFGSIMSETSRAAARCGGGAVMGSKNLKAVAIRGTKTLPLKNPDEFNDLAKQITYRTTRARGQYPFRQRIARWHTCSHSGATHPLRNYSWSGHVEEAYKINTERQERRFYLRVYSCPSFCFGHCFEHGVVRHGPYAGISGENSEWDTSPTILGTGLTDVEAAMTAVSLLDKLGLDGSSCGNTMAWAIECYQRGLLTKEDTDGLELTWDNPDLVIKLLKKIAFREGPFATLLGEGTKRASEKIGRDAIEYACQAWGLENAAVDPRAAYPTAVGQATSARGGGDHLTDRVGHLDSLCVCSFVQLAVGGPTNEDLVTFVNYSTGWDYTEEELTRTFFERLLSLQRAFNVREFWPTKPSDIEYNAPKFYREPIYAGPLKGTVLDKAQFEAERAKYYDLRGWDERGIPKKEMLKEHGLDDVLAELKGIGVYE